MKTLQFNFKSNGENIQLSAVINDSLTELSKSKKNQATDIIGEDMYEGENWGLFFEISGNVGYEIQMKLDKHLQRILTPIKAITWEGGADAIITDEQKAKITIK